MVLWYVEDRHWQELREPRRGGLEALLRDDEESAEETQKPHDITSSSYASGTTVGSSYRPPAPPLQPVAGDTRSDALSLFDFASSSSRMIDYAAMCRVTRGIRKYAVMVGNEGRMRGHICNAQHSHRLFTALAASMFIFFFFGLLPFFAEMHIFFKYCVMEAAFCCHTVWMALLLWLHSHVCAYSPFLSFFILFLLSF
ncbi:dispersed gene family protein 1 (DGF-1) [Trypanosoma cruzi]|nr:dispersed gene family protein 1 (DGF-1) [Trypanosoma cruzi]